MNIVELFKKETLCKDCLKGQPLHRGDGERILCGNQSHGPYMAKKMRCDSGLWVVDSEVAGTRYPCDLKRWIAIALDFPIAKFKVVPREDWPQTEEL